MHRGEQNGPGASQVIAQELESGESLLWSGQPRNGVRLQRSDILQIPFSLFWGGFAVFWEMAVFSQARKNERPIPLLMALWGVPFVLVGLYLIFGRFVVDARQRENTYYGLTDRRVVIVTGLIEQQPSLNLTTLICRMTDFARRKVKSLDLRTLGEISMTERSDGSGTITFGSERQTSPFAGAGWPGRVNRSPSFDLIDNVKSVYDQIRGVQRKAS